MSPYRERQSNFMGYQVGDTANRKGLKGRMAVLNIIKNRHGEVAIAYPLLFIGEIGLYAHLPKDPKDFNYESLDKINELKYYGG